MDNLKALKILFGGSEPSMSEVKEMLKDIAECPDYVGIAIIKLIVDIAWGSTDKCKRKEIFFLPEFVFLCHKYVNVLNKFYEEVK